jgi:diguanylate cyclase (GGDEF)-like protein
MRSGWRLAALSWLILGLEAAAQNPTGASASAPAAVSAPTPEDEAVRCFTLRRDDPAAAAALADTILATPGLSLETEIKTLSCQGMALSLAGDAERARKTAQRVVDIVDHNTLSPAFQLRALSNAGAVFHNIGDIAAAETLYERAYEAAQGEDGKEAQQVMLTNLAMIHSEYLGDPEAADRQLRAALALATSKSTGVLLAYNFADNLVRLQRYDEAAGAIDRAEVLAKAEGSRMFEYRLAAERAMLLQHRHQDREARRLLETTIEAQRALPDPGGESMSLSRLSALLRDAGELPQALAKARRAVELAESAALHQERLSALSALAEAQAAAGQAVAALRTSEQRQELEIAPLRSYNVQRLAQLQARLQSEADTREIERLRHESKVNALTAERDQLVRRWELITLAMAAFVAFAVTLYQRRVNRKLHRLSTHDVLTGLPNRRAATRLLDEAVAAAAAAPDKATRSVVLLIDIDHFKSINDRLGHDGGDLALKTVAEGLRKVQRSGDVLARWGGEEFLVIAHGLDFAGASALSERLRSGIERLSDDPITVSIGFAPCPFFASDAANKPGWKNALGFADHALYAAKHSGRNGWVGLWPRHHIDHASASAAVLADPQRALRRDDIEVRASAGTVVWKGGAGA